MVGTGSWLTGVGGFGEGKNFDRVVGRGLAEGVDNGEDCGAGGKDVIDEEDGLDIGKGVGDGVDVLELGFALFAGEAFVAEGGCGFLEEGGEVLAAEGGGEVLAEEVEGGRFDGG